MKIHPTAEIQSKNIGEGTVVWQFAIVLSGAVIGKNCNINCFTFIENDVVVGDNVTIKSGVYVWDGIEIEDNVFVGPNVVFTNDLRPRSKQYSGYVKTVIKKGASLGAGTTILAGVNIGEYAMTGIGAVITHDVPPYALVFGNPAKVKGWVDEHGQKLFKVNDNSNVWQSKGGDKYEEIEWGIKKINR